MHPNFVEESYPFYLLHFWKNLGGKQLKDNCIMSMNLFCVI